MYLPASSDVYLYVGLGRAGTSLEYASGIISLMRWWYDNLYANNWISEQILDSSQNWFTFYFCITNGKEIYWPQWFLKHLLNEFWTWMLCIEQQAAVPVIPWPSELEVTQMVREPIDEAIEARCVHCINSHEQDFSCLSQHLWQCRWLQFAQFDQNGSVANFQVAWRWHVE